MRTRCLPAALILSVVLGCDGAGGLGGGSSPEAVLQTAEAARKREDWQTYVGCHTPETHAAMVRMNLQNALSLQAGKKLAELGGAGAVAQVEQKLKPLNDIFAKHGISSADLDRLVEMPAGQEKEQAINALADRVSDKRGFAADMMAFSHKAMTQGAQVEEAESTIKSVTINGDRATAVVSASTGNGPAFEVSMQLQRTTDGWKIDNTQFYQ